MPRHVRKGDLVIVTSGDHKGQTGEVLEVTTDKRAKRYDPNAHRPHRSLGRRLWRRRLGR